MSSSNDKPANLISDWKGRTRWLAAGLLLASMLVSTATPALSQSSTPKPILGGCNMDTCGWSIELSRKKIGGNDVGTLFKLRLLGGTSSLSEERSKRPSPITWNANSHEIFIFCSKAWPTVMTVGSNNELQADLLPLNSRDELANVFSSAFSLYAQICHGASKVSSVSLAKRHDYDLAEYAEFPTKLRTPEDILAIGASNAVAANPGAAPSDWTPVQSRSQNAPDRYAPYKEQERANNRALNSQQRAQDRYDRYRQQKEVAADAGIREAERLKLITDKIYAFSIETPAQQEEAERYCQAVQRSDEFSGGNRAQIRSACQNILAGVARKREIQSEKRAQQESAALLKALLIELDGMPANAETIRKLNALRENNGYRLATLTFSDQNAYYQRIGERMSSLVDEATDQVCAGLVSKSVAVPVELKNARIADGLRGVSLTQFTCGALLVSSNVSLGESGGAVVFRIEETSLRFELSRYLSDQRIFVPMNSPVQGGVATLTLLSVVAKGKKLNVGNPNFFIANFYSQWTPQLSVYLKQNGL